jgi:tryptophan synthase alpha chain
VNVETPALSIYLMAGDALPELAAAAVRGGATIVEVGIPFSDPLADGPTIQQAGKTALDAGMTPRRCLDVLAATREAIGPDIPLVPMTYAAIVERYGIERFCEDASAAGANGLIVADVPPEEAGELGAAAGANGMDLVQLVALTSRDARIALAAGASQGFIYVVAAIGTTGARDRLDTERLRSLLTRVRAHANGLPLLCGFGVSSGEQVALLREAGADGVIVGSAAIEAVNRGGAAELERFVSSLAGGL